MESTAQDVEAFDLFNKKPPEFQAKFLKENPDFAKGYAEAISSNKFSTVDPQSIGQIESKMHPEFSSIDRALVKNFSNSPEDSISYLKEKYPTMTFINDGKEIYMKKQGSKENFHPLDPDTGFFSSDFVNDAIDIGGDVVKGVAGSVGAGMGGLAGFATGGPIGAFAGAVAGGAAGSGLADAGLQGIGRAIGINKGISLEQIAGEAGAGALGGAIGGGPIAKGMPYFAKGLARVEQGAADQLLKQGLASTREWAAIQASAIPSKIKSQMLSDKTGGLIGLMKKPVGAGVTSAVSTLTRTPYDYADSVLNKPGRLADSDSLHASVERFRDSLTTLADGVKKQLGQQYDKAGIKAMEDNIRVDVSPVIEKLKNALDLVSKKAKENTGAAKQGYMSESNDIKAAISAFGKNADKNGIPISGAEKLKQLMSEASFKDTGGIANQEVKATDAHLKYLNTNAKGLLSEQINKVTPAPVQKYRSYKEAVDTIDFITKGEDSNVFGGNLVRGEVAPTSKYNYNTLKDATAKLLEAGGFTTKESGRFLNKMDNSMKRISSFAGQEKVYTPGQPGYTLKYPLKIVGKVKNISDKFMDAIPVRQGISTGIMRGSPSGSSGAQPSQSGIDYEYLDLVKKVMENKK